MKCNEVQTMQGPYLDSELDAKTTLEIEQHLTACPACARLFAQEQKLEARMTAGLNRGSRTAGLWAQIEREVTVAASASRPQPPALVPQPAGWLAVLSALSAQLRARCQSSRWAWTGLAAVWAVILVLDFSAREPETNAFAKQGAPSVAEIRLARKQRERLMAELAVAPELAPADKPKTGSPSPRSDRRIQTLNT
jgi:anti-sigma factor RsiW